MDIRIIIRLHELIEYKRTGSPFDCASKLGVSERTVYNYIAFMKNEMLAPISYDMSKSSYCYNKKCNLNFKGA